MAPGVPGQIILSPQVAPALPISPVIESIATMEKVCCENPKKGRVNSRAHRIFLIFLFFSIVSAKDTDENRLSSFQITHFIILFSVQH
jgi:hypothetical protein